MMIMALALSLAFSQEPYTVDGDTLYYHHLGLRLHGINAPELRDKYGQEAKEALENYIEGKKLECEYIEEDKYKRLVVKCLADGKDVGKWMVMTGWAVAYTFFSKDYVGDEVYAKARHLGMWRAE